MFLAFLVKVLYTTIFRSTCRYALKTSTLVTLDHKSGSMRIHMAIMFTSTQHNLFGFSLIRNIPTSSFSIWTILLGASDLSMNASAHVTFILEEIAVFMHNALMRTTPLLWTHLFCTIHISSCTEAPVTVIMKTRVVFMEFTFIEATSVGIGWAMLLCAADATTVTSAGVAFNVECLSAVVRFAFITAW